MIELEDHKKLGDLLKWTRKELITMLYEGSYEKKDKVLQKIDTIDEIRAKLDEEVREQYPEGNNIYIGS